MDQDILPYQQLDDWEDHEGFEANGDATDRACEKFFRDRGLPCSSNDWNGAGSPWRLGLILRDKQI